MESNLPRVVPHDTIGAALRGARLDSGSIELRSAMARVKRSFAPYARGQVMLGRYVVGERLGEGGSGVVFAARDTALQRDVAIKVVVPARAVQASERARLRREAMTLAQLSHPNVVAVLDARTDEREDTTFIVMQLVRGRTLQQWLAAQRQPWSEVVRVFCAAGRGLAAAHRRGLVHRDFKPANVLLGPGSRVRVADFGLARASAGPGDTVTDDGDPDATAQSGARPPSRPRFVMGTVPYMAPEHLAGEPVDARADQFAFCVALYEALLGVHPFGDTPGHRARAAARGELREPPSPRTVPRRLLRILRKGLAARPTDRWSTMEALVAALAAPRPTRRWALVGAGLVLCVAVLLVASLSMPSSPMPAPQSLQRRASQGASAAPDTGAGQGVRATTTPQADALEAAYHHAMAVHSPEAGALATQRALLWARTSRDPQGALRWARHARAQLDAQTDPDGLARALQIEAQALRQLGRSEEAHAAVRRAAALTDPSRDAVRLAIAWAAKAQVLRDRGELESAESLGRRAIDEVSEVLGPHDAKTIGLQLEYATTLLKLGRADEAHARLVDVLQVSRAHLGPGHVGVAHSLSLLGRAELARGHVEAAARHHRGALAILGALRAADHPDYGAEQLNLALALSRVAAGDALELAVSAVRVIEAAHGTDHPVARQARAELARIEARAAGDTDDVG